MISWIPTYLYLYIHYTIYTRIYQ